MADVFSTDSVLAPLKLIYRDEWGFIACNVVTMIILPNCFIAWPPFFLTGTSVTTFSAVGSTAWFLV